MTVSEPSSSKEPHFYLNQLFTLPCGIPIKNRILKSAMSEQLGTIKNAPTEKLVTLYSAWANGGTGILVTGNIMIDRRALGEPNNVVVENENDLKLLQDWAKAGTQNGTQLWAQLNHPGKQSPRGLCSETVAPSAIPFTPELKSFFATPRAMTENEIQDVIERFGHTANIIRKAGFSGIQVHGAHGYLVSQFLSPHHNVRTDQWGGSLTNRMRFPLAVYDSIRAQVGKDFPISFKLNSADFQRGGFEEEDAITVMKALSERGIDLIEVSGGNYEKPAMSGLLSNKESKKESTKLREAYFLEFAEKARKEISAPLCVTGGFRTTEGMAAPLQDDKLDFVGIARPLAMDPNYSNKLLTGEPVEVNTIPRKTGIPPLDRSGILEVYWYGLQLKRIAKGKSPKPNESGLTAFLKIIMSSGGRTMYSRLRA